MIVIVRQEEEDQEAGQGKNLFTKSNQFFDLIFIKLLSLKSFIMHQILTLTNLKNSV